MRTPCYPSLPYAAVAPQARPSCLKPHRQEGRASLFIRLYPRGGGTGTLHTSQIIKTGEACLLLFVPSLAEGAHARFALFKPHKRARRAPVIRLTCYGGGTPHFSFFKPQKNEKCGPVICLICWGEALRDCFSFFKPSKNEKQSPSSAMAGQPCIFKSLDEAARSTAATIFLILVEGVPEKRAYLFL